MSASWYSNIIVGVRLKELYKEEIVDVDKTKYNEDTGEPYTTKVRQINRSFGNMILPSVTVTAARNCDNRDWDFTEKIFPTTSNYLVEGLHTSHNKRDMSLKDLCEMGIVGLSAVFCDDYRQRVVEINFNKIEETKKIVIKRFKELGYNGDVSVFHMLKCSY